MVGPGDSRYDLYITALLYSLSPKEYVIRVLIVHYKVLKKLSCCICTDKCSRKKLNGEVRLMGVW